jgi:hypothetical protein
MERRRIRARSAREAPQAPRLRCETPPAARRQQARDVDACRHLPPLAASRRALQVTTTSQIAVTPAAVAPGGGPTIGNLHCELKVIFGSTKQSLVLARLDG